MTSVVERIPVKTGTPLNMNKTIKILHVEDLETDAELVKRELKKGKINFQGIWASNRAEYENALRDFDPDIVLCDHSLPSFTSTDALMILKESGKRIPFILVTATVSEEFVVAMMKEGIDDYILKDRLSRLPSAVLNALEKVSAEKDKEKFYNEIINQEKRFRALIENISEAIVVINADGKITYQSPSASRVLGFLPDETINRSIFSFFHPSDVEEAKLNFEEANRQPETPLWESFRVKHKNGNYVWVEGTITNLLQEESVNGFVINYRDITERKIAEQMLRDSEANLSTVFNNTDMAYVLVSKELNIVSFNHRATGVYLEQTGKKLKEGTILLDYIPVEHQAFMTDVVNNVLAEGVKEGFEKSYPAVNGSLIWYEVCILPVFDEAQNILGIIVSTEDITERKNTELEREKMTTDLIQHNKNLEQFAYIISHNLRSPVANIIGLSNMIQTMPDMSEADFDRCMDGLVLSVKKLDDTIIDLNYILQMRREINEKKEVVRFSALVKDIRTSISNLIEKENITMKTSFLEVNEFFTIKSYLNSIFYNLISNSIKYRNPDKLCIIEIESKLKGNKLCLIFRDNGLGIDMGAHRDKIFGLYKKFHTHIEGKGMGLYMVKTQVEILGGTINVQSKVNEGTQFTIEFPL
ncbi:MAG: domain S-box protein [Bacteroidetes bacterium]|jgi:PAS domain S-box-containing protein|nr:domain S-box protein [Bacteroidota bacterium]